MKSKNEIKKVIVIQVDPVLKYPPTIRLINELCALGKEVYLLSTVTDERVKSVLPSDVKIINVGQEYRYNVSAFRKLICLRKIRAEIWKTIKGIYDDSSLLWVMSNITIKHLGKKLTKYRYNLHLFELVDEIYYFGKMPIMRLGLKRLAERAYNVIVPEYNRAHITKAWLRLSKLPLVIENRPVKNDIIKNNEIRHSDPARDIINKIGEKKIILYQGIVDSERPIEKIAEAVESMEGYIFLVLTDSKTNLSMFSKTLVIPFVAPPFHLEITSHAHIGVLLYQSVYDSFASPLNSIYCAPNKLFEYAQFGIPMIGNDIPGLHYTIDYNNMGTCVESLAKEEIVEAIQVIDANYEIMSQNSREFYKEDGNDTISRAL